jgi:hypothetical protein
MVELQPRKLLYRYLNLGSGLDSNKVDGSVTPPDRTNQKFSQADPFTALVTVHQLPFLEEVN